jgi:hypothetical protein
MARLVRLGSRLDDLVPDYDGRLADVDLASVKVDVAPAKARQLAAP